MAANCVKRIFNDDEIASKISKSATSKVLNYNNKELAIKTQCEIYEKIINGQHRLYKKND